LILIYQVINTARFKAAGKHRTEMDGLVNALMPMVEAKVKRGEAKAADDGQGPARTSSTEFRHRLWPASGVS